MEGGRKGEDCGINGDGGTVCGEDAVHKGVVVSVDVGRSLQDQHASGKGGSGGGRRGREGRFAGSALDVAEAFGKSLRYEGAVAASFWWDGFLLLFGLLLGTGGGG